MAIPYFVADAARVTILRPLASSAFGSYSLTLPDGIDLEDVHDFEAPGNELGHVATLTRTRRVGGLARRFVRADVSVTAADPSNPDWFPESNVDAVLEEAATRVSSDFFLESDITKAGLGPWVPFVDFKVGDRARVNIWGHVVTLPITRIEPVISDHDVVDWLVHLGGQLVSDDDAREVENENLRKAFLQDRRELAGIEATAKNAEKTADTAKSTADTAKTTADDALAAATDADGVIQGYVEEGRQHRDDAEAWATAALEMLADIPPLLDDAELINQQIEGNLLEVQGLHTRVRSLVQRGQGYVTQAYSAVALAQSYNAEISTKVAEAKQAVVDGLANVSAAEALLELVIGEGGYLDQAEQILASTESAKNDATGALQDMNDALDDIDGAGTPFAVAVAAVLTAHNDTLEKHGQVLSLHTRAIRVTARAVQSANSAASYALLGVQRLSEAIALMQQANIARDEAILAAASAASDALTAGEKLTTITERLAANQELQVKINRLLARAISMNSTATAFATQAAQSAGRAAGASLEAVAALSQTILEREAAQEAAVEGINVALKLQENAIKWASVLATRVFSSPNINPDWGQASNEWVTITKTPNSGINVAPLTSSLGFGDWFGDITIHYVNIHGQSVVHRHTKTVQTWEGWWLTEAQSGGPVRDVVVTLVPYRFHARREYVFPYTRGGSSFDPVSTYAGIPQAPVRRSDNSYTFSFAVFADRPVRVSPDEGVTWYTVPAGSEIPALDRVLPTVYTDGPIRRVVTFTERYRTAADPV